MKLGGKGKLGETLLVPQKRFSQSPFRKGDRCSEVNFKCSIPNKNPRKLSLKKIKKVEPFKVKILSNQ
ncbi:MAG: hypothetical protein A2007_00245 [Verrucomicrobia bacterium GWC2_42_7]|nr:MAG: hypothetical protein A2007_00245 [Verrucomicrobia bacterium GWC2_42_7]